ncbi:MAG TPA: SRPBCC domain-containing protein [Saprospiraceae bacterium]|nr:SRPBCC domain-containing protein [Saprospiraceae bacterium]
MKKVESSILIENYPAKTLEAFTSEHMLKDWWGVDRSLIKLGVGGLYTLAWSADGNGFSFVMTGLVREYDPEHVLRIGDLVYLNPGKPLFGPMSLTMRAKDLGGTTELYLCQDGYRDGEDWDWYYQAVREAWPKVLVTLKQYLEKTGF